MMREAIDTIKMGVVIILFAAVCFFGLYNVVMMRRVSNAATDRVEKATDPGYAYIKEYVDKTTLTTCAEAYALYGYCKDSIEDVTCTVCTDGAPGAFGTDREMHNRSTEDLCLKTHLSGNCKVKIVYLNGGYHMYVYPAD